MKESIGRKILNKHNEFLGRKQQKATQQLGRHEIDARLSKEAYEKKRQDFNEWMVEKYHNNAEHGVWINNKLKEIKVAFRGTDNLKDLGTDAYLALGKLKNTDRYKKEDNLIQQLKRMYPNYKITLTGHSLSASIASELSKKYNLEGSGFNAGFGISGNINNPNFTHYRTSTDPISILGKIRGQKFETVDGVGHSINSII
jgi:hypothetical protein